MKPLRSDNSGALAYYSSPLPWADEGVGRFYRGVGRTAVKAYYNEFDPKAAEWLRELIGAGLIPAGDVDERSICDVRASDLDGYTQIHLFAGVGGWPFALRLAGWPDDRPVWTGSCPCQDFSTAGKREGHGGKRNLWPEMLRLIRERRPAVVFGEQVAAAIRYGWLDGVCTDLEELSYACGSAVLPAAGVGAPHIRSRLYWVANAERAKSRCGGEGVEGQAWSGRSGPADDSAVDRLAHAKRAERREDQQYQQLQGRREQTAGGPCCGRNACGLADPALRGLGAGGGTSGSAGHAEQRGEIDRVDDSPGTGRQGAYAELLPGRQAEGRCAAGPGDAGFWSDFRIIQRRDGKCCRVPAQPVLQRVDHGLPDGMDLGGAESAFPLAGKIKGRAMILAGYGNAIVPELAAEFIRACEEAIGAAI